MLRELVIFICAVGIVRAGASRHEVHVAHNEPTQSPVLISTPAPGHTGKSRQYYGIPTAASITAESHQSRAHQQVHASSPTVSTHQRLKNHQPKNFPAQSNDVQAGANPTVVNSISRPVPVATKSVTVDSYGSDNFYQQHAIYDATPTSEPVYSAGNYINYTPDVASYATNSATVRPFYAVPLEANTVTVESNGAVNVHSPAAYATHNIYPDVTYASNTPTVRPYFATPVQARTVTIESNGAVNTHHPAAYATHQVGPDDIYASNTPTVRPYYAVPVQPKTVTIESNGAVNAHHPAAYGNHHVGPAVTYVNNVAPASPYYGVPIEPKTVTVESHGAVHAHPHATYATHHVGPDVTYASNTATVRPYYAVPVQAQTVTIESNGVVDAHHPTAYANHHTGPAVGYYNNAETVRPYYAVPVQAKTVTINSNGAVNGYSPAAYASHNFGPDFTYANNGAPIRPYYAVPVAAKTVTVESHGAHHAHSPSVAYPVNPFNTLVASEGAQYAGFPGVSYAVNPFIKSGTHVPVASRRESVESFNSVTARPPLASSPGPLRYAPVTVAKPIPVPVIYRSSAVETHHPSAQQFAVLTQNIAPTAASYAQAPVRAQHIPVQIIYPTAGNHDRNSVRYQPVPHANSFVEKVYAPVGPTPIPVAPAGPQYGYARAVSYSPASAVSSVTFNGLGVSYGW